MQYKFKFKSNAVLQVFVDWFRGSIFDANILGNYSRREPNSVVIMDNASIHKHKLIEEMCAAAGARRIWLPPSVCARTAVISAVSAGAPPALSFRVPATLNPIELGFNDLKKMIRRFRRRFRRPTGANSDAATFELMGLIPQKNWWGYFHSAGVCPPWQSEAAELTSLLLLQVLQLQLRDY